MNLLEQQLDFTLWRFARARQRYGRGAGVRWLRMGLLFAPESHQLRGCCVSEAGRPAPPGHRYCVIDGGGLLHQRA
jgi:hypothetical protein